MQLERDASCSRRCFLLLVDSNSHDKLERVIRIERETAKLRASVVSGVGDPSEPRSVPVDLDASQLRVGELELAPLEGDACLGGVPEGKEWRLRGVGTVRLHDLGLKLGEGASVRLLCGDVPVDGDGDNGSRGGSGWEKERRELDEVGTISDEDLGGRKKGRMNSGRAGRWRTRRRGRGRTA